MFSTTKTTSFAIAALIAASMATSLSSIALAAPSMAPDAATAQILAQKAEVTRSDARKIVNDYLKEKNKRNLAAGRTTADGDDWVVKIKTPSGLNVGTMRVNRFSGELSQG